MLKADFSSLNIAPVLGFGVDVQANDDLFINIGLRFGYGLNDATKKFSEADMAIDGKHSYFSVLAHTDAADGTYNYQQDQPRFGGFTLGVIYKVDKLNFNLQARRAFYFIPYSLSTLQMRIR
jgi:hypothetical protein